MHRVVVTTGGTGGHIFPAVAVCEELRERGATVLFIGSSSGPEKALLEKEGIAFEGLDVRGFLGRGLAGVWAAGKMLRAFWKARGILRRFSPHMVVGFGSYASFAPLFAAQMLGIPTMLHEQNAIAGTSNRIMGRRAVRICLSLPETEGFPAEKCVLTGNPVRKKLCACTEKKDFSGKHLLVLGGSQGAHALNLFMIRHGDFFLQKGISIIHQTGTRDEAFVREAMGKKEGYQVHAFVHDMAGLYQWADLAFCRSGASTCAELCVTGVPAFLVPFPHAIHDHQTKNALLLQKKGAAQVMAEEDLEKKDAEKEILHLLEDGSRLFHMHENARLLSRPEAAHMVAEAIVQEIDRCSH